jgi:hypothetical protein
MSRAYFYDLLSPNVTEKALSFPVSDGLRKVKEIIAQFQSLKPSTETGRNDTISGVPGGRTLSFRGLDVGEIGALSLFTIPFLLERLFHILHKT